MLNVSLKNKGICLCLLDTYIYACTYSAYIYIYNVCMCKEENMKY